MTTKSTTDLNNLRKMLDHYHDKYGKLKQTLRLLWIMIGEDAQKDIERKEPTFAEEVKRSVRL